MLKSQSARYKVIVRESKVPKMSLLRAPARHNGLKGGRFSAPPPFVGFLSQKLFRLVLKSRILSFQSILPCRGSQKLHFRDLGLTNNYFVFF